MKEGSRRKDGLKQYKREAEIQKEVKVTKSEKKRGGKRQRREFKRESLE